MAKGIIFDYGGVFSIETNLKEFAKMYAQKLGADPDTFWKVLDENWQKAKINEMNSQLFWKNLAEFLNIDKDILRKDLMDYFGFRQEVLDLVKKLKENYKLAMISNQIEDWLEEVIEQHKLNDFLDVITTSYRFGKAKPDQGIFRETIEKLDLKSEEIIFIDDQEKNLSPAREVGMKTILFKDTEQLINELNNFGVKV